MNGSRLQPTKPFCINEECAIEARVLWSSGAFVTERKILLSRNPSTMVVSVERSNLPGTHFGQLFLAKHPRRNHFQSIFRLPQQCSPSKREKRDQTIPPIIKVSAEQAEKKVDDNCHQDDLRHHCQWTKSAEDPSASLEILPDLHFSHGSMNFGSLSEQGCQKLGLVFILRTFNMVG